LTLRASWAVHHLQTRLQTANAAVINLVHMAMVDDGLQIGVERVENTQWAYMTPRDQAR